MSTSRRQYNLTGMGLVVKACQLLDARTTSWDTNTAGVRVENIESLEVWGTSRIKLPTNEVNYSFTKQEVSQTSDDSTFADG